MMFAKDVRKQLSQIMQKIAKGPLEVQSNQRWKESRQDYKSLRRALCIGYGNQLAERMIHHNGYRTLGYKSQLVQVHPSSVLQMDEDGCLPNYVVYHELIATSRPFMRNVCVVEMPWVLPVLKKLEKLDINKLSGSCGSSKEQESKMGESLDLKKQADVLTTAPDDHNSRIQAARERFLTRKSKK